jgi:hypothetical protein
MCSVSHSTHSGPNSDPSTPVSTPRHLSPRSYSRSLHRIISTLFQKKVTLSFSSAVCTTTDMRIVIDRCSAH